VELPEARSLDVLKSIEGIGVVVLPRVPGDPGRREINGLTVIVGAE
jgi:hypothetical protein